jgi:PAS domain S-box-containing protein
MKRYERKPPSPEELRRIAEERLREHRAATSSAASDPLRLLHELQVHEIELELQNEELQRSRSDVESLLERYSDLYDFAPVGYFTLGRDGTIRQANLTGARLLGVERAGLAGRRFSTFLSHADRRELQAALAAGPDGKTGRSFQAALAPLSPSSAQPVFVQLTLSVAADGDECRVVAIDVSERRRAEEGVRASQKMEAIGRLAGGVAHDFNNLLSVILSHAEFGLERLEPGHPVRGDLEVMKVVAERAAGLTKQLLAFSQGQRPKLQLVDLNELVSSVANMLGRLLGEDVELELALPPTVDRVEADRSQLEQVIVNLAVNARDAMPRGGKLTLSTANVELDESNGARRLGAKPGAYVALSVRDTGVGIDATTMGRLFEPFFTTKQRERGTGFGLSTVYGIVKQCEGDIAVHSQPGAGATFEIFLPRAVAAVMLEPSPVDAEKPLGGNETILVVEDEAPLRQVVKRLLEAVGYTVLTAPNGEEALETFASHGENIRLTLSDVVMPKMGGVELVSELRRLHPDVRVVFMSGYSGGAEGPGESLGVRLLDKPFTAEGLRRIVREALDA